jgi:hypothetical protein
MQLKGITMHQSNIKNQLCQSINALKCLSISIELSIEQEAVTADQVGDLLAVVTKQLEATVALLHKPNHS